MSERSKKIYVTLCQFYNDMKELESITDKNEREGKKATLAVMTTNDIEAIIENCNVSELLTKKK